MLKKIVKLAMCVVAGQKLLVQYVDKKKGGKVIILMYHRVTDHFDLHGLAISPAFFERQLQYIVKNYVPISLSEAIDLLKSGQLLRNYVVLTFDDGFRDNYFQAYPLLKKYNVPATLFIACDAVEKGATDWGLLDEALWSGACKEIDLSAVGLGKIFPKTTKDKRDVILRLHHELKQVDHLLRKKVIENILRSIGAEGQRIMLTWEEVAKMGDDCLITIGAHTVTHPILSKIGSEDACFEIENGKCILEEKIGGAVDLFAYPNGTVNDFSEETIAIVKAAGFRAACTTISGVNRKGVDPFRLHRIDVTYGICQGMNGKFSEQMFGAYISGAYNQLFGFLHNLV